MVTLEEAFELRPHVNRETISGLMEHKYYANIISLLGIFGVNDDYKYKLMLADMETGYEMARINISKRG
jgi:hypothetical protein